MKLKKFFHMSTKEKGMFFLSFFLLGLARLMSLFFNYKQFSPYLGYNYKMLIASIMTSEKNISIAIQIQRMIQLTANYTPWRSNCLTQAMVAVFWCKFYKIPYLLFIGIAKKSEQPLGKDAHAWLTTGPVAISGGLGFDTYQVVYTYSNFFFNRL